MTSTILFATGIVGFIVLLVFILSYISIRQRRREAERRVQFFLKTASGNGMIIYRKDVIQHRVIGWDEIRNRILYVEFDEGDPRVEQVALDEVASCRLMLNNQGITEKVKGEDKVTESFISSVKIRLIYADDRRGYTDLGFFKYEIDTFQDLAHLKQVAGEWEELINAHCRKGNVVKMPAKQIGA